MRDTPIQLLLIEDNSPDVRLLREMLSRQAPGKFALVEVGSMRDAESHLAANAADIILLDLGLPDAQGLEVVRRAHAAAPRTPLVVLTGCDDELMADEALREGAQDFLVKGKIDTPELLRAIRYSTQRVKAELEMQQARDEAETASRVKGELLAELKAAYAETELFLRSIPSIVIGIDPQGHITRWNLTATNTFGLDDSSVHGRGIEDCGIRWLRPEMKAEITRWLTTESFYRCDNLPYERDSKMRLLGLSVLRIPAESTDQTGFIITGADITERMGLELQLRQAQKLEGIGQLAAGIAHEINTPTQFVGDNIRFLKDSWGPVAEFLDFCGTVQSECAIGPVSPEHLLRFCELHQKCDLEYLSEHIPKAIDLCLEGVKRIAKIVKGFKEFSHPGSEEKRAIDLNHAIETTISVARHEWKYCADLVTALDNDLPLVPCLVGEFNQVMLNLIVNAAHAISSAAEKNGTGKGTITISTRREGEWVEVTVADTGTGIPVEIRSRVFEPFFTTKEVGKGTGQGLALAHAAIVNRHQGQLWFESELEQGTTFIIRLPLEMGTPRP
ncbi:MAG: ATP-binding protein [Candidatus Sulfotelmatobacter sp.]|jgi:two-component system, NtrC family, sensor kinase